MQMTQNSPSLSRAFKTGLQAFREAPLFFLLLQIPEASVSVVGDLLPAERAVDIVVSIALLFPYFCICSFVTSAATFVAFDRKTDFRATVHEVASRMRVIFPVSIITGIIILLGIGLLILPGLYFMVIYFFVPFLIMSEPKMPWALYLLRSKQMAWRSILKVSAVVLLMLVVGLVVENVPIPFSQGASRSFWAGVYAFRFCVTLFFTALGNLWAVAFFRALLSPVDK